MIRRNGRDMKSGTMDDFAMENNLGFTVFLTLISLAFAGLTVYNAASKDLMQQQDPGVYHGAAAVERSEKKQ